jgi:hypothetical protein
MESLSGVRNGFRKGKDSRIFCPHPEFLSRRDGQLGNEFPKG